MPADIRSSMWNITIWSESRHQQGRDHVIFLPTVVAACFVDQFDC